MAIKSLQDKSTIPLVYQQQPFIVRYFTVIVILLIGISVSSFFSSKVRTQHYTNLHKEFDRLSQDMSGSLQKEIKRHFEILYAIRNFYASSQTVEREEFHQFVSLELTYYPDIFSIEWLPRVRQSEIAQYEQTLTINEKKIEYKIHDGVENSEGYAPIAPKEEYYPVYFLEPFERNKEMLGFDHSSIPARLDVMTKAEDSLEVTVTPISKFPRFEKVSLDERGFLAFVSIHDTSQGLDTVSKRREYLKGYIAASFNLGTLIQMPLRDFDMTLSHLAIYAASDKSNEGLVYDWTTSKKYNSGKASNFEWRTTAEIGKQMWTFVFHSTPEFIEHEPYADDSFIFIIGVLLTFLLAGFFISYERKKVRDLAIALSLTDELTGLYNRRGFNLLLAQQIKISMRNKKGFLFLSSDLDDLKKINDKYGHPEGDKAVIQAAGILRETLRVSDIIARLGGDEFAVICLGVDEQRRQITLDRLREAFKLRNEKKKTPYDVDLSIGDAYFDPGKPVSLQELVDIADKALYEKKTLKHIN